MEHLLLILIGLVLLVPMILVIFQGLGSQSLEAEYPENPN